MSAEPALPENDPLRVTQLRGFGILAFRATILAGLPTEMQARFLANLEAPSRELMLHSPDPETWIPVERLQEIRAVFNQHFGLRLERVRGLTMASLLFSSPLFEPLKNTRNIAPFLARLPQIWEACHRGGRVEAFQSGPGSARISIQARLPYPQYLEEVIPPAFQEVLHLLGLRGGKVKHIGPSSEDPPETHHYDLSWEP